MLNLFKRIFAKYFNSWWIPVTVCLLLLAAFAITVLLNIKVMAVLLVCWGIAFLGILCAAIWNLIKKRWAKGLINLAMLPACCIVVFFVFCFLWFHAMMGGPIKDGFADNLTIPANIDISEPLNKFKTVPENIEDGFQHSLLTALSSQSNDDPAITANVASLVKLHQDAPGVLMRFLATSPAWHVSKERGNFFATRRWLSGTEWLYSLSGYYTRYDVPKSDIPNFQFRFSIGFSGKPWASVLNANKMDQGQPATLRVSTKNKLLESNCIIRKDDLVVEIFEQSEKKERRLTQAALSYVNKELEPLVAHPDWTTIRNILPAGSIRQGKSTFELRNSFQPGIYDSEAWVNPGEPGMLYLKAFEVTKGTPLSAGILKARSSEWIGWSDNPQELFFSNTNFTIYEGDWGKPYAARFEVWFVPDSGTPERKLMERVFKIEGWQR